MSILQFKKKEKVDDRLPHNCIIMGDGLTATKSLQLLVDFNDVKIDRVMTESQREEILQVFRLGTSNGGIYPRQIFVSQIIKIKEIVDSWDNQ